MPRLRLGAALLLPSPLDTEVDALRRAVGDGSLGRIPSHLTLVPPVNVHERDVPAALALLRQAAAEHGPFALELGPAATFLPDTPVLFLDVAGPLAALHALRDGIFRPPLERRLSWPFVPHVTLADEAEPTRIEAAVVALADFRAAVTFDRVHLLSEEGRVWSPWADARMGATSVVGRGGLEVEISPSGDLDAEASAFEARAWAGHDEAEYGPGVGLARDPLVLTARLGGAVVGVARGWVRADLGYLEGLIVDEAHRGLGVGSHLLAAFEDHAHRRGARRMAVRALSDGPARRFYEGRGWVVEAELEDWMFGRPVVQLRRDR